MDDHPSAIRPAPRASYHPAKVGKTTLSESPRLLVGVNAFEPGQAYALHAHAGMDKVYQPRRGQPLAAAVSTFDEPAPRYRFSGSTTPADTRTGEKPWKSSKT
jgi:hypothetical protein